MVLKTHLAYMADVISENPPRDISSIPVEDINQAAVKNEQPRRKQRGIRPVEAVSKSPD